MQKKSGNKVLAERGISMQVPRASWGGVRYDEQGAPEEVGLKGWLRETRLDGQARTLVQLTAKKKLEGRKTFAQRERFAQLYLIRSGVPGVVALLKHKDWDESRLQVSEDHCVGLF